MDVITNQPVTPSHARVGPAELDALERKLAQAGLDISLRNRYAVVFAFPGMGVGDRYPELAGCTLEVCTFIDEASVFAKHGIGVVGLSGEAAEPPEGCLAIPFPVGQVAQHELGDPLKAVERDGRRYAERMSWVIFPDGNGVRISEIGDVARHVRECLDAALQHRLERMRRSVAAAQVNGLRSTAALGPLLANGSDSVAITRVDVTVPLVAKLASPLVIRQEAGYMRRMNTLLEEAGRPRLFPAVLDVHADEEPAWYLMEAADPTSLDQLLFSDDARTVIDPARQPLLAMAIDRLSNLYELTFRPEVPEVAPYHYRDRFFAIPARADTRRTFEVLVGGDLDAMLAKPAMIDGLACAPYAEQVRFLSEQVDRLVQPVGAYLHGDAHLPNMLLAGDDLVFIDPRVAWDGNEVVDPGFGDPIYDFATLLHSTHVMSAILYAIEMGRTGELLDIEVTAAGIEAHSRQLRVHGNPSVEAMRRTVADRLPTEMAGADWGARLHVGVANALIGWLKTARAVQTEHAWMAIHLSALYHLELARRELLGKEQS